MRTVSRLALLALLAVPATDTRPAAARGHDDLAGLVAAFEAQTGARLVFAAADLPAGDWFEVIRELPAARRPAAARIALAEAGKYPPGYLRAIGLGVIGVFDGLASTEDDGYHPWIADLGGYRYFGEWNRRDAVIAAYYSDEQLPLTLHHEVFHHVDATVGGVTSAAALQDDDARFAAAMSGSAPYPAATISSFDLAALRRAGEGDVLDDAVSDYTAKSPGEDQAETARWLWSHLPDALVQVAQRPALAGSQRLLHVIAEYAGSAVSAPDPAWMIDVALGRSRDAGRAVRRLVADAARLEVALRDRIAPGGRFVVWGQEDGDGVNRILRGDLARFGVAARAVTRAVRGIDDGGPAAALALTRDLALLAHYHTHIANRWTISAGTERSFARARDALLDAMRTADPARAAPLAGASFADLAGRLEARGVVTDRDPPPAADNPYLANVDAEIPAGPARAAIRRVQPATVRIGFGSGVNLDARGVFVTAAHVAAPYEFAPRADRRTLTVLFPDGSSVDTVLTAIDPVLDLAVLEPEDAAPARALPWAPLAILPPVVGQWVCVIGHPGAASPDGEPTGYQPWNVSTGAIRAFDGDPLDDQRLGGTEHDAWTYWGHSGSPLFDERGRIVALHNSWDSSNGMRHAIRYEAIRRFLDDAGVAYHLGE